MAESRINIKALFDLQAFSTSAQNLERRMMQTSRKLNDIGKSMSMAFTLPLVGLGGVAIKAAADIESLKTSLQTALGGTAKDVENVYKAIQNFAASTPYSIEEITRGFIKLKNMGLDPSMEALTSYGNTASAMGKSLNDMVEAVADAAVGEFERLKEFGIKASSEGNRVKFTFKGVTTEVGKNSDEIQKYLLNIGNTEFAGGIEKQSQTFNGMISTMKDNLAIAAASFGEILLPFIKRFADAISKAAKALMNLNPETKKLILLYGGLLAAIGPVMMAMSSLTAAIAFLVTPLGLIVGIVGALTLGLIALNVAASESNKYFEGTKNVITSLTEIQDLYQEQLDKINNLKEQGNNVSKEQIEAIRVETLALAKQTEIIIAQANERKRLLKISLEEQMNALLASTRGVGMQSEFISADLAKVEIIKKNIEKLDEEIQKSTSDSYKLFEQLRALDYSLQNIKSEGADGLVDLSKDKKAAQEAAAALRNINKIVSGINDNDLEPKKLKIGFKFSEELKSINKQAAANLTKLIDIEGLNDYISSQVSEVTNRIESYFTEVKNVIASGIVDLGTTIAEGLGSALSGNGWEGFGNNILKSVGKFISQLGQLTLAYGVNMALLDMSIKGGPTTWPIAIAAGLAMIAAGAAISGTMSQGLEGANPSGTNYTTPSSSNFGSNYQIQPIVLETKISGRELILVTDRANQFRR